MDTAELEAAGLYDPRSPRAADRLALLEWLAGRGVTLAQMVDAVRLPQRTLTGLAGDLALRPDVTLTREQLAERVGVSVERLEAVMLAAGVPPIEPGAVAYTEDDVDSFRAFALGAEQFG